MKPIAAISLGAMLSLAAFGADAAQLRLNATVTDDAVRLGDLFDGLPKGEAERPVAPAPVLGRTNAFDADFLRRLATTYHVDWQPASKDTRILVTRAARTSSRPARSPRSLCSAIRRSASAASPVWGSDPSPADGSPAPRRLATNCR